MSSHVWHPFTQHGLNEDIPEIARAEGALLHGADGRSWIDAISSWWVTTHGHCEPRIMAAIGEQAQKLDQLIFAGWTHGEAERLADRLVGVAPAGLGRCFFSDSGSTSVEVALKMALGYWANVGEARRDIVVMEHSYHGDTVGAMSVGERGPFNAQYEPLLFDVTTVPFPTRGAEQATFDALEEAGRDGAAAFIVEPLLLGAGGMLVYSSETLGRMREICAAHGVLFIADEVLTGWGRTGTRFACEQAGIAPDLMCLSKGLTGGSLPLAATLTSEAVFEAHYSTDRSRMFYHSSSYTANAIACAAANANLDIWDDEPVMERIAALGERQEGHLIAASAHDRVTNPRRVGTLAAIDIVDDRPGYLSDLAPRFGQFFRERGVLLRPLGNALYVMPPYCTTPEQLDRVWSAIGEALDTL